VRTFRKLEDHLEEESKAGIDIGETSEQLSGPSPHSPRPVNSCRDEEGVPLRTEGDA